MTFKDIEALARFEIADEVGSDSSRRVTTAQMLNYANEAENEACIRARLLTDSSTAEICSINLQPGVNLYNHDSRIVQVLRGRVAGAYSRLGKISHTMMDELICADWEDLEGTVEAFVTGMDTGKIRLFRKPVASATLNLTVVRLPLNPMTSTSSSPEITARLHQGLVLWIKHKVYNNQDSELFDKNRADVHLQAFTAMYGPRPVEWNNIFSAMELPYYGPCGQCDDYQ